MKHMTSIKDRDRQIIREYAKKLELYQDFASLIAKLLTSFLRDKNISFHSITYRHKDVYRLKDKIKRKKLQRKYYQSIHDIADLAGVRVITYFNEDVSKIISIIDKEFTSVSKNKSTFAHVSGYKSHHCDITLGISRCKLTEYRRFKKLRCEIQVRTLLQHAWAEIEHGIGYKALVRGKEEKREQIRKIFLENAQLLEAADDKFVTIRKLYTELQSSYMKKMAKKDLDIPISYASVRLYLMRSMSFAGKPKAEQNVIILTLMKELHKIKSNSIKDLRDYLRKNNLYR